MIELCDKCFRAATAGPDDAVRYKAAFQDATARLLDRDRQLLKVQAECDALRSIARDLYVGDLDAKVAQILAREPGV